MPIDLITATDSEFSPFVGQKFNIEIEGSELELVLNNVHLLKNVSIRDNQLEIDGVVYPPRAPFALTFTGPLEPVLRQNTYRLNNKEVGTLDLFLSPFSQDSNGTNYECVIS